MKTLRGLMPAPGLFGTNRFEIRRQSAEMTQEVLKATAGVAQAFEGFPTASTPTPVSSPGSLRLQAAEQDLARVKGLVDKACAYYGLKPRTE